ncbi:MAG: hypothetical protein NTW52_08775 [Planctomycetota bacterium]|nr:hypothetical protein [Planctomycetota bacterium]
MWWNVITRSVTDWAYDNALQSGLWSTIVLQRKEEGKGKLVKLDPSRLADRGLVKRPQPTTFFESLKLSLYFLGYSPKKVASSSSETKANNHIHRVHILSPDETESVLNVDDIGSATFHDLAVAAVLKAVDQWNQCQKNNRKKQEAA